MQIHKRGSIVAEIELQTKDAQQGLNFGWFDPREIET